MIEKKVINIKEIKSKLLFICNNIFYNVNYNFRITNNKHALILKTTKNITFLFIYNENNFNYVNKNDEEKNDEIIIRIY